MSKKKHKATLIRTQDNRGYVFDDRHCVVCELHENNGIKKIIRTGRPEEVHMLKRTAKSITLPKPLYRISPPRWVIVHYGGLHLILIRRRLGRTIVLEHSPTAKLPKPVEIVDVESSQPPNLQFVLNFPLKLPGLQDMPDKCTLEHYLELIPQYRICKDKHPHVDYVALKEIKRDKKNTSQKND